METLAGKRGASETARERQTARVCACMCVCWRVYAQLLAHENTCYEIFGLAVDPYRALGSGVHSKRDVWRVFALM